MGTLMAPCNRVASSNVASQASSTSSGLAVARNLESPCSSRRESFAKPIRSLALLWAITYRRPNLQIHVRSKVLVVDDNAGNRAPAQASLADRGHDVVLAATGEDGVRAFEVERPDCVLLDLRMPGTDGFAVCAHIRSLSGGAEIPIHFLTALRDVDTFDRALRAGCDDFLTKPFQPAELIVRVETALELRRMGAELREH